MTRNPRDIHGDGHGFVDVPVGRRTPMPVELEQLRQRTRFNYDLTALPTHKKPFLGLYRTEADAFEPMIILRAPPHRGLNFVSYTNHHYVWDPIAWAELPDYDKA
jgi:hypothetical protein